MPGDATLEVAMSLSGRRLEQLAVVFGVLTAACALPTIAVASFLLAGFVLACQACLRFQTALSEGKAIWSAVAVAAIELWKDLWSKQPAAQADTTDQTPDTIPTGTTTGRCVAQLCIFEEQDLSRPESSDNIIFPLEMTSNLEALTLSSTLELTTTSEFATASAVAEGDTPSAAQSCAAVEEAVKFPDGTCMIKVVTTSDNKDANLLSLGSSISRFPSSSPSSAASRSSPSSTLDSAEPESQPEPQPEVMPLPEPAAVQPQHQQLPQLPSSLSCGEHATLLPVVPHYSQPTQPAKNSAAAANDTSTDMGLGPQAAVGAAWLLPAGLMSESSIGAAAGAAAETTASAPSSSSSSLPLAPAGASCQGPAIAHDQQLQQQQALAAEQLVWQLEHLLPVINVYKVPATNRIFYELHNTTTRCMDVLLEMCETGLSSFKPFYAPDARAFLAAGAYGTVCAGKVYTSCGIIPAVAKTAADPTSDVHTGRLILEGRLMLTLQAEGRVNDACTVRALALCEETDSATAINSVTLLLERAQYPLSDELADAEGCRQWGRDTVPVLALPRAFQVLHTVAAALVATHQRGFVHQDIKPDNILVREDGSVCLSDFGLAAAISADGTYDDVAAGGSPYFSSPEVAQRHSGLGGGLPWPYVEYHNDSGQQLPLTVATDIWSLGVLAVCLLVTGTDYEAAAHLYVRGGHPLPAYVPAPMAQLIRDCTAEAACQRPSAEQVLQRLAAMKPNLQQYVAAAEAVVAATAAAAELAADAATQQLAEGMAAMLDF